MSSIDHMTAWMVLCIILVAAVVVVVVIGLFRLRTNRGADKTGRRRTSWFEKSQPHLMLFFLVLFLPCVIFSTVYYADRFNLRPVASPAIENVGLFNATAILTGVAFVVTQTLLFYFAFAARATSRREANYIVHAGKLEWTWLAVPTVCFLILFGWGWVLWQRMTSRPSEKMLPIEITGQQYSWTARYPGQDGRLGQSFFRLISTSNRLGIDTSDVDSRDDFVPVQMHVPKGTPVELTLRSNDVIHSFYIPHFGVKMDAVPGMITTIHFTATMTTAEMRAELSDPNFNYEVACAELCGPMHFAMKLILVVDEPDQFSRWYRHQQNLMEHVLTK
jgi:cytochrome c oxidase subunit 2